jgi:hypothetical protein
VTPRTKVASDVMVLKRHARHLLSFAATIAVAVSSEGCAYIDRLRNIGEEPK